MHRILPGAMWRNGLATGSTATTAAVAATRLDVFAKARVRAGRSATVRWRAAGAQRVTAWRVLLDGRRVGTVAAGRRSVLRKRINRSGRHRWKVVGVDATGAEVVVATRSFRAVKKR
jgi:hypothetical protein